MQQFIDLPLSLKAAVGGAIILILLLVLKRQRQAEGGSAPAREKKAKAPKAEKAPKTPKAKKAKADKPARTKRSKVTAAKDKAPKEKRERRLGGRRKTDVAEPESVPAPVAQPTAPAPVATPAPLAPQPGWPTPGEMAIDPAPIADAPPAMHATPEAMAAPDPAVVPVTEAQPTDPAWTDTTAGTYDAPADGTWTDPAQTAYEPGSYDATLDPAWAEAAQTGGDAPVDPTWVDPAQGAYDATADQTWADPGQAYEAPVNDATWTGSGEQAYDADATWVEPTGAVEDGASAEAGFDPATGWADDTTWAPVDDQDTTSFGVVSNGEWSAPEGEWESAEESLPETPQAETEWSNDWTASDADATEWGQPEGDVAPETVEAAAEPMVDAAASADDLDWSALGSIDADIPATPWTEDQVVSDPSGEGLWEPVEGSAPDEVAINGTPFAADPIDWDAADTSWDVEPQHVNGSADLDAVTGGFEDMPVNGDASSVESLDIESAIRSLEGDEASVVIDLAKVLDNGRSVELVIEPTNNGKDIRLRVVRRDGASPTGDVTGSTEVPAADAVVEPASEPVVDPVADFSPVEDLTDAKTSDVEPASQVNGVNGDVEGDPAPVVSEPVPAAVASPPVADAGAPADPLTGSGDQDPARILADIRSRLAALDAQRGSDA